MNAPSATPSRRRFLKLTGGAVALIPLVNLYGCGEEAPERSMQERSEPEGSTPEPGTRPTGAADPAETAAGAPGDAGAAAQDQAQAPAQTPGQSAGQDLPRLEESNPQAQALGYKHSVEDVDQSAYPNYQEGQHCGNCNLYQPEIGEDPWGGCQLFPGNLVNFNGWCSAWVPQQT